MDGPLTSPGLGSPADDVVVERLLGRALPLARLRSTQGVSLDLADLPMGRSVVFVYSRTTRPGSLPPTGWDEIPGARGCTAQLCSIRDSHSELISAGAVGVYALSAQDSAYQSEVARRLDLAFPLLADPTHQVADALDLPTFSVGGLRLYRRLTLVVHDGVIERAAYPVTAAEDEPQAVVRWLRSRHCPGAERP